MGKYLIRVSFCCINFQRNHLYHVVSSISDNHFRILRISIRVRLFVLRRSMLQPLALLIDSHLLHFARSAQTSLFSRHVCIRSLYSILIGITDETISLVGFAAFVLPLLRACFHGACRCIFTIMLSRLFLLRSWSRSFCDRSHRAVFRPTDSFHAHLSF